MRQKTSILIVEDEIIVAEDMKTRLQTFGYRVVDIAVSAQQAIALAEKHRPNLVLMDIKLKGETDGIKAAEKIRSRFDIPVIYVTAYADEKILQRLKKTEPFGYIIKPSKDRELRGVIETALYKHQIEKKIKENEAWLYTILRSIADAVITTDRQGKITFMNLMAERMTGWKQSEAKGKHIQKVFKLVNEATNQPAPDPVKRVLTEGAIVGLANHTLLVTRDGIRIPIFDSGAPIKNDRKEITGIVFTFQDATDERKSAEALRESEEKFKNLFHRANYGIILHDMEGYILDINQKALQILGYSLAEILSVKMQGLHPAKALRKSRQALDAIIRKGSHDYEIDFKKKNGEVFPAEVSSSMFEIKGEKVIQEIFREITKYKKESNP